jgi:hypothetical protein
VVEAPPGDIKDFIAGGTYETHIRLPSIFDRDLDILPLPLAAQFRQ